MVQRDSTLRFSFSYEMFLAVCLPDDGARISKSGSLHRSTVSAELKDQKLTGTDYHRF